MAPAWIEEFRGGVVVGDGNDPRVTAFDPDGTVRWIYAPRTGDGPGEMRFAAGAAETREGLWVLAYPPRLILLSDEGVFKRQLRINPPPKGTVSRLEGVDDKRGLIRIGRSLANVSFVDGQVSHESEVPWRQPPPEDWFGEVGLDVEDGRTAVGMTYGPELLLLEADSVRTSIVREEVSYRLRGQRVDMGGGMSRFVPPSGIIPYGTWRVQIVGSELWVLTGGAWLNDQVGIEEPRLNNRLLIFATDGTLKGERSLPFETEDMVVTEDRVYLLSRCCEDSSTLLSLRRR